MACWEQAADVPSTCASSLSRFSGPVGDAVLEINIPIEEEEENLEICLPIEEEEENLEICLPIEEEELEICLPIKEEKLEICLPIVEEKLEIYLPIKEEGLEICLPIEDDVDKELGTYPKNQQKRNTLPAKRHHSCVNEIISMRIQ